ncbi:hypothetical protein Ancab_001612, partial [Ancistrocladus abbreviatus]
GWAAQVQSFWAEAHHTHPRSPGHVLTRTHSTSCIGYSPSCAPRCISPRAQASAYAHKNVSGCT